MSLLLDTHTSLWFHGKPEMLPPKVLAAIEEAGRDVMVSMASLWEIAIKVSIGKLSLPMPFAELYPRSILEGGLSLLPIEVSHLVAVSRLPLHHRDPFDRVLIAQAQSEGMTLVSCDPVFASYDVPVLW